MLRVGLTGGIGSGKSTVAERFKRLNIPVIDTDTIAHQIITPDGPAYQAVINEFGTDILGYDQLIDRRKLGAIVFTSAERKKTLESLLHPIIWLAVEQQLHSINAPYCIVVVPLLFEGQNENRFDRILVVDTSVSEQTDRIKQRDARSESEIQSIISAQVSREYRLEHADDIINNNGDINQLKKQVQRLHEKYLKLAKQVRVSR